MDWRRSCSRGTMQIERPSEGQYIIPIVWYRAPPGALTYHGENAFCAGIWDRDTPALPFDLGEQPPYNSPYYGGKNVWQYTGQCAIGTADEFAYGLTQERIDAIVPDVNLCCGEACPPALPPVFTCPLYPLGMPARLLLTVVPPDPLTFPFPDFLLPVTILNTNDCNYFGTAPPPIIAALGEWLILNGPIGGTGGFESFDLANYCHYSLGRLDTLPQFLSPSGSFSGPIGASLNTCLVRLDPIPPGPPMQTITLGGDVAGSAVLGPTGCLIVCALQPVLTGGGAGDSTHVPQITWDAKGRLLTVTDVAIAAAAIAIGDPVSGGSAFSILFVDGSGDLGQDPGFQWGGSGLLLSSQGISATKIGGTAGSFGDGTNQAALCDGTNAGRFADSIHNVEICNGTDHVSYSPIAPANWNGAAPTDLWIAVDRLAQWMSTNFPLLTPP